MTATEGARGVRDRGARCSCGAQEIQGCDCSLTPVEFFASLREREERRAARAARRLNRENRAG